MTTPPINVMFVTIVRTDWAMVIVLVGLVVAVVSSFAAREYRREVRLPQHEGTLTLEREPVVKIDPDPQVVYMARVFGWVARAGLVVAALAAAFMMFR